MISKESVNRSVIHRYSLYFQTENKIVAPDTRQLIINAQAIPFLTTIFLKSPIIHVWQVPKYAIGFSCCKARYYLLSFRWSLLVGILFLRYRNQVSFLRRSMNGFFYCICWLRYMTSFQNLGTVEGSLTSAFGSIDYRFNRLSRSYFKICICSYANNFFLLLF